MAVSEGGEIGLIADCGFSQQREILDALPAFVFLERCGRIVFANAVARELMGVVDREWVHCPVDEVLWGFRAGTAEPRTSLTGNGRGRPFHATMSGAGGRIIPVEGTYSLRGPELDEGIIVALATGPARVQKPSLVEHVISSIPDAVIIVRRGRVLYANPAFTRLFGFTADEVSGENLLDFIVPKSRRSENASLLSAAEGQSDALFETECLTSNGKLVTVALQIAPLLVNGDRAGQVLTCRLAPEQHVGAVSGN